jgi:transaldolase
VKFFIDTANLDEIREAASLGVLDGVTTNPSLVAKEGRDFMEVLREIVGIVDGPISAEVVATDYEGMLREAEPLARVHENIVIKVPLTKDGIRACRSLREKGTRVNVTLCFSATQALLAAKAGASYVSPFVGRLDDVSAVGTDLIRQIREIYDNYGFETEILAASIRHPVHVLECALAGADVATIPFKVLEALFKHPLTDAGIAAFVRDWEKAKPTVAAKGLAGRS